MLLAYFTDMGPIGIYIGTIVGSIIITLGLMYSSYNAFSEVNLRNEMTGNLERKNKEQPDSGLLSNIELVDEDQDIEMSKLKENNNMEDTSLLINEFKREQASPTESFWVSPMNFFYEKTQSIKKLISMQFPAKNESLEKKSKENEFGLTSRHHMEHGH